MKRQLMAKKYGDKFKNMEKRLFHGTAPQNVDKINAGGLNRSYAGANGKSLSRHCLYQHLCIKDF